MNSENSKPDTYLNHRRRSIVREFLVSTSIHGLPGIGRGYNIKNFVFWLILFVIFLGAMVYFVTETIINYLEYPSQTKVELETKFPMYFPAFTLCNISPGRSDLFLPAFLNWTTSQQLSYINDSTTFTAYEAQFFLQFLIDQVNNGEADILATYSFSLDDMLINCSYNGHLCNKSNFIQFSTSSYTCHTFNAKTENQSIHLTTDYGGEGVLQLELYIHEQIYLPYVTSGYGIITKIHDNTQLPRLEFEGGIALEPGKKHTLTYTKKLNTYLGSPYTSCTTYVPEDMKAYFERYGNSHYEYSNLLCWIICQQSYVFAQCGCGDPSEWNARTYFDNKNHSLVVGKLCNVTDTCYSTQRAIFLNNVTLQGISCPLCSNSECEIISFDIQVSAFKAVTTWKKDSIKQAVEQMSNSSFNNRPIALPDDWSTNWTNYIDKNYVNIQVIHGSYRVETYTEKPTISWSQLVSTIGEYVGLWIGVSVISFIEVAELIYRLIRRHFA